MKTTSCFIFLSFPQATNQTLLDKFKRQHEGNSYIEFPAVMEPAFIIRHYAGKVKYGVKVSALAVSRSVMSPRERSERQIVEGRMSTPRFSFEKTRGVAVD